MRRVKPKKKGKNHQNYHENHFYIIIYDYTKNEFHLIWTSNIKLHLKF